MVRFKLFGIPVEIQPWFWLTLAIFGGISDATSPEGLMSLLLFILAGFLSILIHELGHALTGRFFGAPTAITLTAFGGYATFPAGRFTRVQSFLVTAAGPAIQLLLAALAFALLVRGPKFAPMGRDFIGSLFGVSLFWALLNLIPVIPLDGGRLMDSTLGPRRIDLTLKISMVVAVIAAVLLFKFTASIFFPLFLGMMAFQNWQDLQQRRGI